MLKKYDGEVRIQEKNICPSFGHFLGHKTHSAKTQSVLTSDVSWLFLPSSLNAGGSFLSLEFAVQKAHLLCHLAFLTCSMHLVLKANALLRRGLSRGATN